MERKAAISNFDQDKFESLSDAWERFNLLLHKCLIHNMSVMEHMTHVIIKMKTPTRMFCDASSGGTLKANIKDEVKTVIENMCQNEYRSSDRAVRQKCILTIDSSTTLLVQIEVLF